MDLLAELIGAGLLDEETAERVREVVRERGGAATTALLELDAVDEAALLRATSALHGIEPADLADLGAIDPDLSERFPWDLTLAFLMCPLRFEHYGVIAWVEAPLSEERLDELRGVAGLEVHQRLALGHHVAVARAALHGRSLDARGAALEATLARRREAVGIGETLDAIAAARDLGAAVAAASAFFAARLELSTFLVIGEQRMRAVGAVGARVDADVPVPEASCTLAAALRFGGYFLGPIAGTRGDEAFFASLGRPVASSAFVAPLPTPDGPPVVFLGENGTRSLSARLAAEISLVTARLAQRGESWRAHDPEPPPPPVVEAVEEPVSAPEEAVPVTPAPLRPSRPPLDPVERAVLARLRSAAAAEGVDLESFVNQLLAPPAPAVAAAPPAPAAAPALAGEVKELFERLAVDIPAQLARGMEAAFRDLGPRIASRARPAVPPAPRPSAAASAELVMTEAKPREVPSYRSRRAKSTRRKL